MRFSLQRLLFFGVLAEVAIFSMSVYLHPAWEEAFRYAARYSGRLSALVFLGSFYLFARSYPMPVKENVTLRNVLTLFATLHLIHWGFLATNVYLNSIPLEPVKVAGGALAYLMIILAPFYLHRVKFGWQLVYFYYVSLVMILTYVARIKGDFEGAQPYWLHYFMLGVLAGSCVLFGWWLSRKTNGKGSLSSS